MKSNCNSLKNKLKNTKTREIDIKNIEFDTIGNLKVESYLPNKITELCANQRIEISNWFALNDKIQKNLSYNISLRRSEKNQLQKKSILKK